MSTHWRLVVRSLDPMDPDYHEIIEVIEVTDEHGDSVFTHEAGVTLRTSWRSTGGGGWRQERIVPWLQVLDFRTKCS